MCTVRHTSYNTHAPFYVSSALLELSERATLTNLTGGGNFFLNSFSPPNRWSESEYEYSYEPERNETDEVKGAVTRGLRVTNGRA